MLERLAYLALTVLLFSCSSEEPSRRDLLPGFIGKPGEVIVIMEQRYWDSEPGRLIREALDENISGMPGPEPLFDCSHFPPDQFDRFIRPHRNIVFVEIQDKINYRVPVTKLIKDKYAKDQVIIEMYAKSEADFIAEFKAKWAQLADRINKAELERIAVYNLRFGPADVAAELSKHLSVSASFLENAGISALSPGFFWAHKLSSRPKDGQVHDVQQGVLVYDFPYVSDSTFTVAYLLATRDSILKLRLPGPSEGSYMQTEYLFYPQSREIEIYGAYALEIKGLWRMENDFMGGPFVSVARLDEKKNRIVVAEGFVFAPKFNKREYLRDVESVIKNIKIE